MDVSGPGLIFAAISFFGTIVFFNLAKDLTKWHRMLASVHGWAALLIFPFSALMAVHYPDIRTSVGFPVMIILGGISAVSVFYSMATVRARWIYHLLHIPTVLVIALSMVVSLFMLTDHH